MPGRLPPLHDDEPNWPAQMADTSMVLIRAKLVEVVIPQDADDMLMKAFEGAETPSQSR
jgi:hypothetical protein